MGGVFREVTYGDLVRGVVLFCKVWLKSLKLYVSKSLFTDRIAPLKNDFWWNDSLIIALLTHAKFEGKFFCGVIFVWGKCLVDNFTGRGDNYPQWQLSGRQLFGGDYFPQE